jgi:hypothetical protein
MSEKVFLVPWGSESVCHWCKKNLKCRMFTEDPELATMTLPSGCPAPSVKVVQRAGPRIRFTQLLMMAALQGCPINEFDPDETQLPDSFKGSKIVIRARTR